MEEKTKSLVACLQWRALAQKEQLAYKFVSPKCSGDGAVGYSSVSVSYGALDLYARAVAAKLQQENGPQFSSSKYRPRAILFLQPGLHYVAAFLGCLYARMIPVPAYPPRNNRHMERLQAVIDDAEIQYVITTPTIAGQYSMPGKTV